MRPPIGQTIATLCIVTVLWAGLLAWSIVAVRIADRKPLIPLERRRPVPWTLTSLIVGAFIFLLLSLTVQGQLAKTLLNVDFNTGPASLPIRTQFWFSMIGAVTMSLTLPLVIAGLARITQAGTSDLGTHLRRWKYDLRLGCLTFAAIAPILFLIQYLLRPLFEGKHPLIDMLAGNGSFWVDGGAILLAVVIAPITEEFIFRVLLQGWLEAVCREVSITRSWRAVRRQEVRLDRESRPVYRPRYGLPWVVPVFISSLVFALGHSTHGSAPYPLFLFACGLGHLYYATHRVLPCIAMHAALNTTSMLLLFAMR